MDNKEILGNELMLAKHHLQTTVMLAIVEYRKRTGLFDTHIKTENSESKHYFESDFLDRDLITVTITTIQN